MLTVVKIECSWSNKLNNLFSNSMDAICLDRKNKRSKNRSNKENNKRRFNTNK